MADTSSSPQTLTTEPAKATTQPDPQPPSSLTPPPPPLNPNPNTNPNPTPIAPSTAPASIPLYAPPISGAAPPSVPSFRPSPPQFAPIPGAPNYQTAVVPPPGVSSGAPPVAGSVPPPIMQYQVPAPGQPQNPGMLRPPYMPMPNGYAAIPGAPQVPGVPGYSPYPAMVRPVFPTRPPGSIGMLPRPPVPVIPGVRPVIPSVVRPGLVPVTPAEKPQTTVYVGKIAPSVENDFILPLLQLCGPVKSWKRPQNASDGTLSGFGFCEFESAEGVLRALRLLTKLNVDGQELMLNVNQATREYLERYVEKKSENAKKLKESEAAAATDKEGEAESSAEKNETVKPSGDEMKKDDSKSEKDTHENANFGVVTHEDREADKEALEKLTNMIEERLKNKPLPPPPPPGHVDGSGKTDSETHAKSKDRDPDADGEKNDDDTTSDTKVSGEHDKNETSSPDKRRHDRRSRERDRDRDLKREKEREVERYEREAERERIRKEREQRRKIEEAEREYEERLRDWEYREREKEQQRQREKEREKERERKRKKEIYYDEEEDDDDSRKRWHRSVLEEKRKKRLREREDDLADRKKEEEEIAEAKRRAEEEEKKRQEQQREALKLFSGSVMSGSDRKSIKEEPTVDNKGNGVADYESNSVNESQIGDGETQSAFGNGSILPAAITSETQQANNAPAKKLGFGLLGSGKRTTVPSVFNEDDDDEAHKDKKMRPLVPIDYSTEEMQAVQQTPSGTSQSNIAAAAEFAKRISNANVKEEKPEPEREKSRRSHDRSNQRDRDRNEEDTSRVKDNSRERTHDRERDREHGQEKLKTQDNKKLLDAKQLIDMIPKTKDDLFSYEINWTLYDEHGLHERMRPWISKKITEFLGEEETSLVDYIVTSTQEHVKAAEMLETLKSILDEEAEMFVLKMWRMLIFEIKKVETGLHLRSRS